MSPPGDAADTKTRAPAEARPHMPEPTSELKPAKPMPSLKQAKPMPEQKQVKPAKPAAATSNWPLFAAILAILIALLAWWLLA
jgi:hypothetical protein